jgi:hypothetical protein
LEIGNVAVWTVGRAVDFQFGMGIDYVEQIAENLIGFVVLAGRAESRAADEDVALECREQRKLSLGSGADQGAEMGETWMTFEDGEEGSERFAAIGLGQRGNVVFSGHFLSS